MRLVDADKLKVLVAIENGEEPITKGELVTGLFDGMKTVEAIPIEWLEKKAQEFAERYWNKKDDHKKLILPMADCPVVIEQMIKEWRVENEE